VTDRFGAGTVGKHLDLYIGEENRENFLKTSPYMFAAKNAHVEF